MIKKKWIALATAGVMSFGIWSAGMVSYAEAGSHHKPPQQYEDGTTNKDSHEMRQEETRHDQEVRKINAKYRASKNEKEYKKELKEEQKRHDKEVQRIKNRYDRHHHEKSY